MKILLTTSVFPSPARPNAGAFNRQMVRGFAAAHEVKVVSPVLWTTILGRQSKMPRTSCVDGVETHHPVYFYTPKILRRWYGAFFWWSVGATLRRVAADFRPDIVVGYWAHPDGQAAVRLARLLGVASAVMVGGSEVLVLAKDKGRRKHICRVLDQADVVVTVGQDLKRAVVALGIPSGKVHVVYFGVDATRFHPGDRVSARASLGIEEVRSLLWVGHMVPVKGLDILIEACALAVRRLDFRVYLVGDGPERPRLERQAAARGLGDRVRFVGYVPHDQLGDWYRAADLTVLPSRSEGVPNVLLESIASGTPFVASRVGGVPEIADVLIDRLVTPGDSAQLANAIVEMLAAPSRLVRRFLPVATEEASAELLAVLSTVARSRASRPAAVQKWAASPAADV